MLRPPFLLQDFDFHDQVADARLGLVELPLDRIVLVFLEAGVGARQRPVAPAFGLVYRPDTSRETASTGSPRSRRSTTCFFRPADHRFISAVAPGQ
jgi:hypothetical protein